MGVCGIVGRRGGLLLIYERGTIVENVSVSAEISIC